MKDYHIAETRCTNCDKLLDGATGEDIAPHPGALSVCIYCCHLMIYDNDMQLRNPTAEEMYSIAGDPDVLRVMRAIKYAKEKMDGRSNDR